MKAWRELRANQLIRELTTPLIIKLKLVVKNTHTELLLLSESLETKAKVFIQIVIQFMSWYSIVLISSFRILS